MWFYIDFRRNSQTYREEDSEQFETDIYSNRYNFLFQFETCNNLLFNTQINPVVTIDFMDMKLLIIKPKILSIIETALYRWYSF